MTYPIPRLFVALLIVLVLLPAASWSEPPVPIRLTPQELTKRLQQAGDDPAKILALTPMTKEATARELRKKAYSLLTKKSAASRKELHVLAQRLSQEIPHTIRSPAQLLEVLGKTRTTSHQLLYRRYLEQWKYQVPLPLVITFDYRKGKEPILRSVQIVPN